MTLGISTINFGVLVCAEAEVKPGDVSVGMPTRAVSWVRFRVQSREMCLALCHYQSAMHVSST